MLWLQMNQEGNTHRGVPVLGGYATAYFATTEIFHGHTTHDDFQHTSLRRSGAAGCPHHIFAKTLMRALVSLWLGVLVCSCEKESTARAPETRVTEAWYEHPSVTYTEDAEYLKDVKEWHSDEYLRAGEGLNMKYFAEPAMVDALPEQIKKLRIGMIEGEVMQRLSEGYPFAWGFNTVSHGLEPIPEGEKPETITFHYGFTEINADRTATRKRFDLLIHWRFNYLEEGFHLTYLDAKLIPPRKN